jgi:hypothetical protein
MTTTDEIIAALRRAVSDGTLLDEAADLIEHLAANVERLQIALQLRDGIGLNVVEMPPVEDDEPKSVEIEFILRDAQDRLNGVLEAERALADDLIAWIKSVSISMTPQESEALKGLLDRYIEARGR